MVVVMYSVLYSIISVVTHSISRLACRCSWTLWWTESGIADATVRRAPAAMALLKSMFAIGDGGLRMVCEMCYD